MHIRPMRLSDIPDTARLCCDAFKEDGTINYILPHLHEHPEDFRVFFRASLRKRMNQVGLVCYVAETDEADPEGANKVVGMATWERVGNDEAAKRWKKPNRGPLKFLERNLQYVEELYLNAFIGNRCVDKKRMALFYAAIKDDFPKEIFQEYWYLHALAIDPAFQRRGIGGMLTKLGVEQAREDGVCATVEASVPGKPMYERIGFRVIKTVCVDPSAGSDDIPVLVWQPEDSKEDWIGSARELFEKQKSQGKEPDDRGLGEKISDAVGATQAEVGAARV